MIPHSVVTIVADFDSDASGAEQKQVSGGSPDNIRRSSELTYPLQTDDTATAILKKKKKPNSLMYVHQIYIDHC